MAIGSITNTRKNIIHPHIFSSNKILSMKGAKTSAAIVSTVTAMPKKRLNNNNVELERL